MFKVEVPREGASINEKIDNIDMVLSAIDEGNFNCDVTIEINGKAYKLLIEKGAGMDAAKVVKKSYLKERDRLIKEFKNNQ